MVETMKCTPYIASKQVSAKKLQHRQGLQMTKDRDDPTAPDSNEVPAGNDSLTLEQMNLLRGLIRTGKLKRERPVPPSENQSKDSSEE